MGFLSMIKKVVSLICLTIIFASVAFAETDSQKIQRLSTQLQKHQIVDATRKGKYEPSDIERRKKMRELSKEITDLRKNIYNDIQKQVNDMEQQHINLLNNLKTCTKSSAKGITGYEYVLGSQNGKCYYRADVSTKYYVYCAFPMSVAKQYAVESMNVVKSGKNSAYIDSVADKYCKMKQK